MHDGWGWQTTMDNYGRLVLVVKTPFDGDPVSEWMPAALAVASVAGWDSENGTRWVSARIVADWEDCDLGRWDRSM
jgi:hypothetical protein